ncbi:hypothetical protein FQA39_LY10232 [Lamprigera yunnana]|nr:hypothetical protein FQA39_LY10232 [Lamprigera yunnana]
MESDEKLGRYFVATKDISEGEIIFQETPLIVGPLSITFPVCVGCGNYVTSKTSTPCSKCGWPLCCKACENSPYHVPECYFTVQRGEKVSVTSFDVHHPIYRCIPSLRCLYQKKFAPDVWKKIIKLESHCDFRKDTDDYQQDIIYVAKFILNFFKVESLFTEEEILKLCGIMVVNSHEIPLSTPSQNGLFYFLSLFEHNCKSNAYKTFTANGRVKLIAGVPIKKGEHISISYTEPLQTTLYRQKHLAETKFFSCLCSRCLDPSEFGTNLTALKCQKGTCAGVMLPKNFQEDNSPWLCSTCDNKVSLKYAIDVTMRVGDELIVMDKGNVDDCKKFLQYYAKLLSPNHAYLIEIKLALAQLIGNGSQTRQSLTVDDLIYKIQLCDEVIEVVKKVSPAEKRVIGIMLIEIYAAKTELQRRRPNQTTTFKSNENPLETLMVV